MPARSLGPRIALAVALSVGFYALAFGTIAALLAVPFFAWRSGLGAWWILGVFTSGGALVILWSVLPRRLRFVPPGPRLDPARHPRLHDEIARIARGIGHRPPDDVFLAVDVNASVSLHGRRRFMFLGLPLLQVLPVSAFRGVLAHEFGHYHGGDTALGPWIYRTREALARTLRNLGRTQAVLRFPFILYARLFTRLTQAVSRRQEIAADLLAARLAGPAACVVGLRRSHAAGAVFDAFWRSEFAPLLDARCRPPFAEGFRRFLDARRIAGRLEGFLRHEMLSPRRDPDDSHPPLAERVKAVEAMAVAVPAPAEDPPALSLLEDAAALEVDVLVAALGREDLRGYAAISWEEAGERGTRPFWERWTREERRRLEGKTAGGLPDQLSGLDEEGLALTGAALGLALARAGWRIESEPGFPVRLRRGEDVVEPLEVVRGLASGELTPAFWRAECGRRGIGALDLAPPPGDAGWKGL